MHVCVTGSPCCTVGKKNCIGEIAIKKKLNPFKLREKIEIKVDILVYQWLFLVLTLNSLVSYFQVKYINPTDKTLTLL